MEISDVLRPELIMIVLFLNAIGATLKYYTGFERKFIPLVLFAVAFLVETYTWYATGTGSIGTAIVTGGLVNGGVAAAIAVFGWDAIYGAFKKKKKEE